MSSHFLLLFNFDIKHTERDVHLPQRVVLNERGLFSEQYFSNRTGHAYVS
jgi:hypothetical protein